MRGIPLPVLHFLLVFQVRWLHLFASGLEVRVNDVVNGRELLQQRRVFLLSIETALRQAQLHQRANLVPVAALAVVLLDNLEEARVVDAAVLLQLLDLIRDGVDLGLEVFERLGGDIALGLVVARSELLQLVKGLVDALLEALDGLLLESADLFELDVEDLVAELGFVLLGPWSVVVPVVFPQETLQFRVVDVLVLPRAVGGLTKSLAETHRGDGATEPIDSSKSSGSR